MAVAAELPRLTRGAVHGAVTQRRGFKAVLLWLTVVLIALPTLMPLLMLAGSWLGTDFQHWPHLREYVLPRVASNTALLSLGVAIGVTTLGVGLAWLSAMCEFPGRRWLDWALVMPLAIPTYVLAFVYVGLSDYAGPVQSLLRSVAGDSAGLPELRSLGGASLLLSLVLYPYVYLLARSAFMGQGASSFEAARTLGLSPWQAFWRVSLPVARPAIVAGLSLALMESLADFGAVSILGVDTFTTAIYDTWFSLQSLDSAAQLATLLLGLVALVLLLERGARGQARYALAQRRMPPITLRGVPAFAALMLQLVVLSLGFLVPVVQLIWWWWDTSSVSISRFVPQIISTLTIATATAALIVVLSLTLSLLERNRRTPRQARIPAFLATLGYAMPGTVLAVGVMLGLLLLDSFLSPALNWAGWDQLVLASSLIGVMVALTARFLRVGHSTVDARVEQIRPHLVESARLLGARPWQRLWRLHVPLLRPGLITAMLLCFVEIMKELPATLILRPSGWDTLAVRIYAYTSEGLWAEAALPALLLIVVGMLPVFLLFRGAGVSQAR